MANQQLGFEIYGKSNATEVMGKAGKEADKLAKKLKNAFDFKGAIMSSVIGAIGAAAIVDKFITSITEGITTMAKAQQESQKAGMDPSEFHKLAMVADKAGVSMESLGKAVRQLKVGMKDALTDTNKMTMFTKGLGFAEEDLRNGKVKSIDVFTRVAMAISSEENESRKLAIATAFLSDKFANELLPTLEKIGNNPDIFKGLNTASDQAYEKADRVYEKWSKVWQVISQSLAVGTMNFLENPLNLGPQAGRNMNEDERETRRKEFEAFKKKNIYQDPEEKLKSVTNAQAIIDAQQKTVKNDNTISNSIGASMGNGPTSGVIGVGNNAQFTLMEEQLDTLKAIRDSIDRLGTPSGMNTDFTKESYQNIT
jgi:hypothetical protein